MAATDGNEPQFGQRQRSPTLADVASSAGVSVSTAGRVLRDEGWPVEESLKERVRVAADLLGYVPNVMARTLRAGAPAMVGLVIGNMLDPYYGEIAEAVTCHSEHTSRMLTMVCNMQRDPRLELDYCRRLWEHRVAGLVLAGGGFDQFTHHDELAALVEKMERGGVVVATLSPRDLDVPSFHVDNTEVGRRKGKSCRPAVASRLHCRFEQVERGDSEDRWHLSAGRSQKFRLWRFRLRHTGK